MWKIPKCVLKLEAINVPGEFSFPRLTLGSRIKNVRQKLENWNSEEFSQQLLSFWSIYSLITSKVQALAAIAITPGVSPTTHRLIGQ